MRINRRDKIIGVCIAIVLAISLAIIYLVGGQAQQLDKPRVTINEKLCSPTAITIAWNKVDNADKYAIKVGDNKPIITKTTNYILGNLTPDTEYTIEVQALSDNEKSYSASEWTSIVTRTEPYFEDVELYPNGIIPEAVIPEEYELVWSDEFNGETLDLNKWVIEDRGDGCGNFELQYYDERGVSIEKEANTGRSCLVITARKEEHRGCTASSGRVNTSNSCNFKYGRVDALIRMPRTANGLWPAFWLLGSQYPEVDWPMCGEIDIVEMGDLRGIKRGTQDRFFFGVCHWGYYEGEGHPSYYNASDAPYSLQDDFHLYTLIWDEQKVATYLDLHLYPDNEPYFEMNIEDKSTDKSPGHYFHQEFFMILNIAIGGNFTAIYDVEEITALANGDASMYVDYVRVYQKK